jgi:hypothetical protein
MNLYSARIWEKAEHWYFDTTIKAETEAAAWKQAQKDYPKRDYTVREIRKIWSGESNV